MSVAARALWFIEVHLYDDLSLEQVASAAGVSRFHLTRAFTSAVGLPPASYVRSRRLSNAAEALAGGAPDIMTLALDSGYTSHEAFTRAFVQQFGLTPEQVRMNGSTDGLLLCGPRRLDRPASQPLAAPRFEHGRALVLAGVTDRHAGIAGLVSQWSRFMPYAAHIDGIVGRTAYGVTSNVDEQQCFDYFCGVEVRPGSSVPPPLTRLTVPPQTYAVFSHNEHISASAQVIGAILDHALTDAGVTASDGPFFERYDERFDTRTGYGGFELWFPIAGED